MPSRCVILGVLLSGTVVGPTLSAPPAAVPKAAAINPLSEAAYTALAGAWVGALTYRDYSSNARVALPTILHVRKTNDGKSLTLHYIYDDGSTKVVQDFETVTIDPAAGTFVMVSGDKKETDTNTLTGLADFVKSGQGSLIRLGKSTENDKPVNVRTTMTFSPQTLTILKETQVSGQAFLFRDQYTLTRVAPVTTGQ